MNFTYEKHMTGCNKERALPIEFRISCLINLFLLIMIARMTLYSRNSTVRQESTLLFMLLFSPPFFVTMFCDAVKKTDLVLDPGFGVFRLVNCSNLQKINEK